MIQPHQDLTKGLTVTLGPLGWYYDYIDVPAGATNLTIFATNLTRDRNLVDLFVRYGAHPDADELSIDMGRQLTNGTPAGLGNSISIGPPPAPGRYWIGLYNRKRCCRRQCYIIATLGFGTGPAGDLHFQRPGAAAG